MVKVLNKIIQALCYIAMTIWPFIFVRKEHEGKFDDVAENHERIHGRQQLEVLIVSAAVMAVIIPLTGISWWWMLASAVVYYTWYGLEYAVRDVAYGSDKKAYRNISFEQEAYIHEGDMSYLAHRRWFAWVSYIGRRTY